ncbi:hypothetical protein GWK36_10920 [Caldichromatium japonicum]|uniref:Uncharacterized protein n=1 Tax=Caldichromatium japonicum TaxID=2699430 RepID=A0A6G7VEV9_9GAMM|nr:hypothetical protein [Caldichromatium japonicum]QIK38406.1 hypothetical protein GWK36_10920 [Caldichromatium japonicum]
MVDESGVGEVVVEGLLGVRRATGRAPCAAVAVKRWSSGQWCDCALAGMAAGLEERESDPLGKPLVMPARG